MYPVPFADRSVRVYASPDSWIEGAAVDQLRLVSMRRGIVDVAAMPDLHPGHKGPVGCAVLGDRVIHPDLIGTDIGCGVTAWRLDEHVRRIRPDKAARALERLEDDEATRAAYSDQVSDFASHYGGKAMPVADHIETLGSVGGGNHFVELQAVERVLVPDDCLDVTQGDLLILVHSGSRSLGPAVHAICAGGSDGLDVEGEGMRYMAGHAAAMAFASLNRRLLAQRAADLLGLDGTPWLDVPHNHVEVEGNRVLHRKGASPSNRGIVPVLGSRGAVSYLVLPNPAHDGALRSIAHGAGRKRDRASMLARAKASSREWKERPNPLGNRVICSDRRLAAEEAPEAYKNIESVIESLVEHDMAKPIAVLRPIVTFKTARQRRD